MDVHPNDVRDRQRDQFFEVPFKSLAANWVVGDKNQLIRRFPFDQTEGNPKTQFPGSAMSAASSKACNNQ
jgi:hypothetical protein